MSTAVATPTTTPAVAAPKGKLSFAHLLRSEWIKFWSVRSTIWTLSIFLVAVVSLTVLISLAIVNAPEPTAGARRGRTTRSAPFTGRRDARPARRGRPRRADHHQRVHDRHDPLEPDGRAQAAAGALVQGDRAHGRRCFVGAVVALAVAALLQGLFFDSKNFSIDWSDDADAARPRRDRAVPRDDRPVRVRARRPAAALRRGGRHRARPAARRADPALRDPVEAADLHVPVPARRRRAAGHADRRAARGGGVVLGRSAPTCRPGRATASCWRGSLAILIPAAILLKKRDA